MKRIVMKGRSVDEATKAGLEVLGVPGETAKVRVLNEGKPAVMGLLGGEEAEVEIMASEGLAEEAREALQGVLDKMGFLAAAEAKSELDGSVLLSVKGEDMGRIIGKEGAMLKALETVVGAMTWKITGEKGRVAVDAGDYKAKRERALERLANEITEEVIASGIEKEMPYLSAPDRRTVHLFLQGNEKVSTFSSGDGKDRKLTIAPKK